MNHPILYMAVVTLFNFAIYMSIPIIARYLILRRPLRSKWIAIGILVLIFIGFSFVTYRIASSEIMSAYLSAINAAAISRDGNPLTKEESDFYRNKFSADASKYALWEAIPAADIQRQKIQRKIDQDHKVSYEARPRIIGGSPILLCVAMALSYFILIKGHLSAFALKRNKSIIQRATASNVIEVNNNKPVCPNCRTEILTDSVYCHKCGNNIAEAYEAKQS